MCIRSSTPYTSHCSLARTKDSPKDDQNYLRLAAMIFAFLAITSTTSSSQEPANQQSALASWISLDAPPGWEQRAAQVLLKVLPGWQSDSLGNLMLRKGSGSPRRVVACGIDRPNFAVSEITDAGYLRLREVGSLRPHPLWIQFHE